MNRPDCSLRRRRISDPTGTPAYDSNGNLTNDSFHTYAWDSDANVTTLDSTTTLIYDALDRRVERATSGVYTQTLYGPGGTKLALVNGATVAKVFVPPAGGATAVYTSSGLAYYRHPDWVGSSRLASTPSRTVYYDGAYAPYGENYAESGTTDRNFTGQNQDTATDLYDFLYREYHPTQGRWVQPDPAGLAAVDISNPQSWNRYGYVRNSPLASVDVNGLCSGDNGNFFDDDNHGTVWFHGPCSGGPIGTDPDTVNVSGLFGPVGSSEGQQSGQAGQSGGGGRRATGAQPAGNVVLTWIKNGLNYLKSQPITLSVNEIVAAQITYQHSTSTICGNIGLGASVPPSKAVTVGILNAGDMNNWKDVVSGTGYSFGANLFLGYQGSFNSSGKVGGPTISGIGLSGSYTYGGCTAIP